MSSVSSVGANTQQFVSFDDDGAGSQFTSVSGQLAALILETQEQRQQIDQQGLASARSDFKDALDDEVQALKDAADATRRGAFLEAGERPSHRRHGGALPDASGRKTG